MKPFSVNGRKACLLISMGNITLRFYNQDHTFEDYDLRNADLNIIIDDEDAFLYPEKECIDYSPQTLGDF